MIIRTFTKFILVIFIMSTQLFASDSMITYEDFVHFNKTQQETTIELVHEFLISYEKTLKHTQKKDRLKTKYQVYLKIMDYFMSSAYAENDVQVPQDLAPHTCLFGGWKSFYMDGECIHPKLLKEEFIKESFENEYFKEKDLNDETKLELAEVLKNINTNYNKQIDLGKFNNISKNSNQKFELKKDTENCSGENQIICQPAIFGQVGKKTFCADYTSEISPSIVCAKAKDLITDDEEKESLINSIASKALDESSGDFFNTLNAMYDTCMCGAGSTNNEFSSSININIAKKMFFSPSCQSLMAQTKFITESLKNNPLICNADNTLNENTVVLRYFENLIIESYKNITSQLTSEIPQGKSQTDLRKSHFKANLNAGVCPIPTFFDYTFNVTVKDVKDDPKKSIITAAVTKNIDVPIKKSEISIKVEEGSPAGSEPTIEDTIFTQTFTVTKKDQIQKLKFTAVPTIYKYDMVKFAIVPALNAESTAEVNPPAVKENTCSAEIIASDTEEGKINLNLKYLYEGKVYTDNTSPEGANVSIKWHDTLLADMGVTATEELESSIEGSLDQIDTDATSTDEEEESEEPNLETIDGVIKVIQKVVPEIEEMKMSMGLTGIDKIEQKRVFFATIEIQKGEKRCKTAALTNVDNLKPSNSSPVQINTNNRMQSGQGNVFQGQR